MPEGNTTFPTDSAGDKAVGVFDGTNFYHPRGDTANGTDVDVTRVPADPFGANADAIVAAGAVGSISAKLRRVTQALEDLKTLIVLGAGTALIGKVGIDQTTPGTTDRVTVGGQVIVVEATLAISTSAYTAADNIGAELAFANATRVAAGSGIIQSVRLVDQDNEKTAKDIVFFADNPSTTFTDNAAMDVADADMALIIGHVSIAASDYISFADNAVATKYGIGLPFKLNAGTTLYAAVIERGAPTYTATTDLVLEVGILAD